MDTFLTEDIRKRMTATHMTWKKLDMCFKWQMIREYLSKRQVLEGDPRYAYMRGLLLGGNLTDVEYSRSEKRINLLNNASDMVCIELDCQANTDAEAEAEE